MSKPKRLSSLLPKSTRHVTWKKGNLYSKMLKEWPQIIGKDLATKAVPLESKYLNSQKKSKNKVQVILGVNSAFAPEVHAQSQIITERLNMFFGYNAVENIKLVHKPAETHRKEDEAQTPKPELPSTDKHRIDDEITEIEDPELKNALKRLGRAILTRQMETKSLQDKS